MDFTTHYESLRNFALGETVDANCHGLAVLIHKGMASWIKCQENSTSTANTKKYKENNFDIKGDPKVKVTNTELSSALVNVLSDMVLLNQEVKL